MTGKQEEEDRRRNGTEEWTELGYGYSLRAPEGRGIKKGIVACSDDLQGLRE